MTGHMAFRLPVIVPRLLLLAALWWLIAQGSRDAWLIGVPAVAAALLISVRLGASPIAGISTRGAAAFLVLFLRESISGGVDVARRTLMPRLRIQPGFREYRIQLGEQRARILLVNCISLLPGTLAAQLDGDRLELHLLDSTANPEPELLRLEGAIARLFRLPLEKPHD